ARGLMAALADLGWHGVVPHFRGCSGEINLLPRAYHSGDHEEVGAMLAAIRARVKADTVVHAAGVSLGGSVLINWLGREGPAAARVRRHARLLETRLEQAMAEGNRFANARTEREERPVRPRRVAARSFRSEPKRHPGAAGTWWSCRLSGRSVSGPDHLAAATAAAVLQGSMLA